MSKLVKSIKIWFICPLVYFAAWGLYQYSASNNIPEEKDLIPITVQSYSKISETDVSGRRDHRHFLFFSAYGHSHITFTTENQEKFYYLRSRPKYQEIKKFIYEGEPLTFWKGNEGFDNIFKITSGDRVVVSYNEICLSKSSGNMVIYIVAFVSLVTFLLFLTFLAIGKKFKLIEQQ